MDIIIVKDTITRRELKEMAERQFGFMVKAVVDVEQKIMAVGGELHADGEALLSDQEGSKRDFIWGINIYPDKEGAEMIEFNSMVNIKPHLYNRSRGVENSATREKIMNVAEKLIAA
jgi:hypothetical protein